AARATACGSVSARLSDLRLVAANAFRAPGVAVSASPKGNRGAPTGSGPGRAEHDQGVSRVAYDAEGLEVLGLGPGLTVLTGLAPPTPSAMAFRMSTSTTNFEPTIFTTTPFIAHSLSEAPWPLLS